MTNFNKSLTGISGGILGIVALVTGAIYPARTIITALLAFVSAGLLIFFFLTHFESLKAFSRKRSTHLRLNNVIMIGLFIFIVVLLNLIIRQYYFRFDHSMSGMFSLSPQSRSVAGMLKDEVQVMFFGIEGDNDFRKMRHLLEAYRHLNKNLVFSMYDLDRVPLLAKDLNVREYNTLVIKSSRNVFLDTGSDEETLTNLLIRTGRREEKNIIFLSGHGEMSPLDSGRTGYSVLAEKLAAQGFRVTELDLKSGAGLLGDVDVLVIAGAATVLSADDSKGIVSYADRGGKLLLLIDEPGPVMPLLQWLGLSVSDYPVNDRVHIAGGDQATPLVSSYVAGGITDGFDAGTVYPGVRALLRNGEAGRFRFTEIAFTSQESWIDRNGDGEMQTGERSGPVAVAGIISSDRSLMKAVIFGDADFASNAFVSSAGNANLFMNAINWLCGDGGLAKITPARAGFIPMYITSEQADLVRLFVPIGIPVIIGALGILIWIKRRSL